MKTVTKTIDYFLDNDVTPPIPLEIIPNRMGINLRSVDSITWTKQADGQLVNITINFIPEVSTSVNVKQPTNEKVIYPRPIANDYLCMMLQDNAKCEVPDCGVKTAEWYLRHHKEFDSFIVRPSENPGWVVFEPMES